ncbi:MAG: peptidoglycan-binding domain-containing protein, partial [Clostridia bacterium]
EPTPEPTLVPMPMPTPDSPLVTDEQIRFKLYELAYLPDPEDISGYQAALTQYQIDMGLEPTGYADAATTTSLLGSPDGVLPEDGQPPENPS